VKKQSGALEKKKGLHLLYHQKCGGGLGQHTISKETGKTIHFRESAEGHIGDEMMMGVGIIW